MTRAQHAVTSLLALGLLLSACGPRPSPEPLPSAEPLGISLPPEWTATPSLTAAPTVTPTPPFGLTWATAVPVGRALDGWVRVESKSASLWLPPGFEVADLGEFGDLMALMAYAMTEAMGEMAAAFATPEPGRPTPTIVSLEELQQAFLFDFVLAGSEADQAALFLVGDPPQAGIDLGAAIQEAVDGFEGEVFVDEQYAIADRPYPTARLVIATYDAESGEGGRHLLYVFIIDDRAWELNYAAPEDRFDAMLPLFEESAASFSLR